LIAGGVIGADYPKTNNEADQTKGERNRSKREKSNDKRRRNDRYDFLAIAARIDPKYDAI
jgi:hypothetical protein